MLEAMIYIDGELAQPRQPISSNADVELGRSASVGSADCPVVAHTATILPSGIHSVSVMIRSIAGSGAVSGLILTAGSHNLTAGWFIAADADHTSTPYVLQSTNMFIGSHWVWKHRSSDFVTVLHRKIKADVDSALVIVGKLIEDSHNCLNCQDLSVPSNEIDSHNLHLRVS
jgi:hypothetical protein